MNSRFAVARSQSFSWSKLLLLLVLLLSAWLAGSIFSPFAIFSPPAPLASSSGCFVQPGKQVLVAVKASVIETSKKIRQRFDYNGTKCHFDDEVQLDHFPRETFRYSMNNCMLESFVQKVEELCNCSHLVAETKPLKGCTGDGNCFILAPKLIIIQGRYNMLKHT